MSSNPFFVIILVTLSSTLLIRASNQAATNHTAQGHGCRNPLPVVTLSQSFLEHRSILSVAPIFLNANARKGLDLNTKSKKQNRKRTLVFILLLLGGDIELNPGPRQRQSQIFPCGYCERQVNWSDRALLCDHCNIWYHGSCTDLNTKMFNSLAEKSASWACYKCHHQNYSCIVQSHALETSNKFALLSESSCSFLSPTDDTNLKLPRHSSPISLERKPIFKFPSPSESNIYPQSDSKSPDLHHQSSPDQSVNSSDSKSHILEDKKQNWRTIIVNCNGARGKAAEISHLIQCTDPDALILTETKLNDTIRSSEFLPPTYTAYRKDRALGGGGVLVAIKSCYPTESIEINDECEIVWASCNMRANRKLIIGSFYRPPDKGPETFEQMKESIEKVKQKIKNNPKAIIMLGGDFNARDIDWAKGVVFQDSEKKKLHEKLLEVVSETSLTQQQHQPSRGKSVLDLYLTNKPGLTKMITLIPGISDHEIVVTDSNIRPVFNKKRPRKIFKYDKADWTEIKKVTQAFREEYLTTANCHTVNENWLKFKNHLNTVMNEYVPCKTTNTKFSLPWINSSIKRLSRKKQRLYKKWKKSQRQEDEMAFKEAKKEVKKQVRKGHWDHVNKLLKEGFDNKDSKPFWRYIKSKRQENVGIAPLKEDGVLHTNAKEKAEILNRQFYSVFTQDNGEELPSMGQTNNIPPIRECTVRVEGILKLLSDINVNKASGPDEIPCRLLKLLAVDIAPILCQLFNQSLTAGTIPDDWKKAKVAPVFKKGSIHTPANYRPVSLTCVCCKLLEHVVSSHIRAHLDEHNILSDVQHGFRSKHSCETQLLTTIQDLTMQWDQKKQVDIAVLDFAKAFDTVPHRKLLSKLKHYGIDGNTHAWITDFLSNREQCVVVDGETSGWVPVKSGVPQGTVLGPLLFLLHINDLPQAVKSQVRLFADDCLLYRTIDSRDDQATLQKDLTSLEEWGMKWGMHFNASKCNILRISRSKDPFTFMYSLCGQILQEENETKYLGVTICNDLSWSSHVQSTTHKASNILAFLKRNLHECPAHLKELAYITLVRSVTEYAATVWDPHLKKDIAKLESVQRAAARFVSKDYHPTSSVSQMMKNLGWSTLQDRRRDQRLILLYKVVNGLVVVPTDNLLEPADQRTRARHNQKFKHLRTVTPAYKYAFFPKTIPDWNMCDFVEVTSLDAFKHMLQVRLWR